MDLNGILGSIIVSLLSFSGVVFFSVNKKILDNITNFLVSTAAGVLLGSAFFHLLPEALHLNSSVFYEINLVWFAIIFALVSFLLLEKILLWHHCHNNFEHNHKKTLGINNLLADGLHNFIDGLLIGSSFLASTEIGIIALIAIILHEIPQEISDFGVLIYSGFSRMKAIIYNFLTALLSLFGVVFSILLIDISENLLGLLLAFTAGSFMYIALADLVPEIKMEKKLKKAILNFIFTLIGLILIFSVTAFAPHSEHEDLNDEIKLENH
ncbi:MAG: ZIP family metal transporter [Candidatus Dojkabacteria bacterium]|nr:MAG: ZIP family metal transporter [Candidatus Dojkabacteria bacterium]